MLRLINALWLATLLAPRINLVGVVLLLLRWFQRRIWTLEGRVEDDGFLGLFCNFHLVRVIWVATVAPSVFFAYVPFCMHVCTVFLFG